MKESKFLSVFVYCTGIKNRCRKTERHQFKVGEFPIDTLTHEELEAKAIGKAKAAMKEFHPGHQVRMGSSIMTEENDGHLRVVSYMPLDTVYHDLTPHFQSTTGQLVPIGSVNSVAQYASGQ